MYVLLGPIREILNSEDLPHSYFLLFAGAVAILVGLALLHAIPWAFMRFGIFILEILSKRARHMYKTKKEKFHG
jgi:hypothetical protein